MWTITKTPSTYTRTNNEQWCIIDERDGDIYDFFETLEEAEETLKYLLEAG